MRSPPARPASQANPPGYLPLRRRHLLRPAAVLLVRRRPRHADDDLPQPPSTGGANLCPNSVAGANGPKLRDGPSCHPSSLFSSSAASKTRKTSLSALGAGCKNAEEEEIQGEFCHFTFLCTIFAMNSQLTPAVPPILRRDRRDGPGGHVAQGREEAPGEDREVRGRRRRAGEFFVQNFLCRIYTPTAQLTPAVPPIHRRDRRDGPKDGRDETDRQGSMVGRKGGSRRGPGRPRRAVGRGAGDGASVCDYGSISLTSTTISRRSSVRDLCSLFVYFSHAQISNSLH